MDGGENKKGCNNCGEGEKEENAGAGVKCADVFHVESFSFGERGAVERLVVFEEGKYVGFCRAGLFLVQKRVVRGLFGEGEEVGVEEYERCGIEEDCYGEEGVLSHRVKVECFHGGVR